MRGPGRTQIAMLVVLAVAVMAGITPRDAQAQGFGVGARMVFVSGMDSPLQDPAETSRTRFIGGFVRFQPAKHSGFELSMDYRSATDSTDTLKVRTTPIQASFLIYPVRTVVAPYLIVGLGWYKQHVEVLAGDQSGTSADTTKFGYHMGLGADVMLGRHASIFVDYRYTFVNVNRFGGLLGTSLSPLTGLLSTINNADTTQTESHLGSMWATGVTFYF